MTFTPNVVNDITGMNPVAVWAIVTPSDTDEVAEALRRSDGPVSIGGGRFSMGGQCASPKSLHLDLRYMNKVLGFSPSEKTIRVQAGARWRDIQRFIDPHGLAVKVMQNYANFTVGGALAVNCHGRYVGLGPIVHSVRSIRLVLADASVIDASRTQNSELFFAAIGGYGGVGVITEAELDLADNHRLQRLAAKMSTTQYLRHFKDKIRNDPQAVFHNADLYPPEFNRLRCVTWVETERAPTEPWRLHESDAAYPLHNYLRWAVTGTPLGKWRREYLIDPLLYRHKVVHWRNYEASYDVAELEPAAREHATYVLQEYFMPAERFEEFVPKMAEIFKRHHVDTVNVSVRHAHADPGTLLAWARGETFAFVVYYKQRARDEADRIAVWTRELIDAAISVGGAYYLPYQPHATPEQFHAAYPRSQELFALKAKADPQFRLRNVLWDKYYAPTVTTEPAPAAAPRSDFHAVFEDVALHDGFFRFLQTIYRLYPDDRLHTLIKDACARFSGEEEIYRHLQRELPRMKPFMAERRLVRPAQRQHRSEMQRQTLELLGERKRVDGYIEIGGAGRRANVLQKRMKVAGRLVLAHETKPATAGVHEPLATSIADASCDVVACYSGLHHCAPEHVDAFVQSVARVLRPGGVFILREHDVRDARLRAFVALTHTVVNAGQGRTWEANADERRHFAPLAHWCDVLARAGLRDSGARLATQHDASQNFLMSFVKDAAPSE